MMQSEHNHASVVLQLEWIGSLHATQVETLSAILTTVRLILLTFNFHQSAIRQLV